jgi:hypothetical protein
LQDALKVGVSLIRLAPGATGARAEVFKYQIDVALEAAARSRARNAYATPMQVRRDGPG